MAEKQNLFDHLPKNYVKIIQEKFDKPPSENLIYQVKSGTRENTDILEALVSIAKTEKDRKEKLANEINASC